MTGRRGRYWVVDGAYPTDRDMARIVRNPRLHVLELPVGTSNLEFLGPVIDAIEHLIVTDWGCRDSRVLGRAHKLVELDLWTDEQHEVDFRELRTLRSVALQWQPEVRGAVGLESVHTVMVIRPPGDITRHLGPNVQHLRLEEAKKISSFDDGPGHLQTFEIGRCVGFDAASLIPYPELRSLRLVGIRRLAGLVELSHRLRLEALILEDVTNLEDVDQLHQLKAGSFLGIGEPFTRPEVATALRRAPIKKLRLPPAADG